MLFKKRYVACLLLAILLMCLGSASASDLNDTDSQMAVEDNATSLYEESVLSINDDSPSLKEESDIIEVSDWSDLQYYCSLSDKNYNLKLKENTNYYPADPSSDSYQIVVNNNVTIMGSQGAYIGDSSHNMRNITYMPIKVSDKSGIGITLQGIAFKWISTIYPGDAVFLTMGGNAENTIKDCTFTDIVTTNGHSSILHIKYGDLNVVNCSFVNCTTDYGCISVYCPEDDTRFVCTGARMMIADSYFEGNYGKTEPGCINNCGKTMIYNTTFYKNSASWWAGAIHTHSGGNTTIYDSDFIDNLAGWNGGALYTYSYLQIYNTTFSGNNCTTNNGGGAIGACRYLHNPYIYIEDCIFKYNNNNCWDLGGQSTTGTGRGGAISFMDIGSIDVINSTFIQNSASMGSAIAVISGGSYGSPNVTIIGNTFINNTKRGDVLYIYVDSSSSLNIQNNTFENSTIELSKLRISSENPVNNQITVNINATLLNSVAYDSDVSDKLKFNVYVDGVFYRTIVGTKFIYEFENDEKHSIYITSSISNDVSNTIQVSNKKEYIYISKNSGNDNNDGASRQYPVATLARAIELAESKGSIIIMDGSFTETNLNIGYDLEIIGENNVEIRNTNGNVFISNSSFLVVKNISFNNLKQTDTRTKIISCADFLIVENCRFSKGTFYQAIHANEIEMTNTVFDGVTVNNYLIKTDTLAADNVSVINNVYNGNNNNALFIYDSSIVAWNILNSHFANNTKLRAGCLYLSGKSTSEVNLYNVVFESNSILNSTSRSYSSCIYVYNGIKVNIDYSTFINNVDSYYSSAALIYNSGAKIKITNSVFLNNTYGSSAFIFYASSSNWEKISPDYNWFGNSGNASPNLNDKVNYRFWYSLNASSSLNHLGPGEKAILTFDLNQIINRNGETVYYQFKNPYTVRLTLSADNGILNETEITLVNGRAQVEFTKTNSLNSTINVDYLGGNAIINITGTKNTPILTVETSNVTAGDNLTIQINLSDDATGETILSINDANYTLEFNHGVATKTFTEFKAGNYSIVVTFKGDSKYMSKTVTDYVTSTQLDSNMNVDVNDSYYVDEDVIVIVTVSSQATGNITISVADRIESKELVNGRASFAISGLQADVYNLTASYSGNIRYSECQNVKSVEILKYESRTVIEADLDDIQLGQDIQFTVHVTPIDSGYVTIDYNGNLDNVEIINGKAFYTISNVSRGDHIVKAIYEGSWKYLDSQDLISFDVAKSNSTVRISVEDTDYGQNATVEVTLISGATGSVVVTVDNRSYTGTISEDRAIITISGLSAGSKQISVSYPGDSRYLSSNNSTGFTVNKADPLFEVISKSVMVGDTVAVNVNFDKNMTGSFTLIGLNMTDTKDILRGGNFRGWDFTNLKPGTYTIEVYYSGDNNYNARNNSTEFTVFEYPAVQLANEGIESNNDKSPFTGMANGNVLFTIDLDDNIKGSIVIDSEGNIYFASNTNLFAYNKNGEMIWKYSADENMEGALSGVTIGRNILISPEEGNKLFFINVTTGRPNVHSNMMYGSSLFSPIIDKDYNIYITGEYNVADNDYKLVIIPYDIWQSSLTPEMISIGNSKPISAPVIIDDNTVAIATVDGLKIVDLSSRSLISANNEKLSGIVAGHGGAIYALSNESIVCLINQVQQWKTEVTGGAGNYLALDGDLGYLYCANSNGVLYKYDIASGEETLVYDFRDNVTSNVLIDSESALYLGTEDGMFYSLDSEGNILWKVNLNAKITGNPVMDEEGFIYVTVNSSKIVKLVNEPLRDCEIDAAINNISYGENLTVEIELGEKTGDISLYLDGKLYGNYSVSTMNNLTVSVPGLSVGKHTADIIYSGDKRFKNNRMNAEFSVSKANVDDSKIIISQSGCSVNFAADVGGNLTVFIDGTAYKTSDVINGSAKIDISGLTQGSHVIRAVYSGDGNHASVSKSVSVNVPVIKLTGKDVAMLYTDGSTYKVRLTSDGIGLSGKTLTITINGVKSKKTTDKNGYVSVKISLIPKTAKYSVSAEYQGIKISNKIKVTSILSAKNVNVKKSAKSLKIKVTLKKVNGKYLKSKKITLKLNKKTYTVKTNKKGIATFKIPQKAIKKLKAGKKYKYQVNYLKDKVKKTITVKK